MFIGIFTSKSGTSELRARTKPAHDEYWVTHMPNLNFAGPMLTDDGETRLGQIVVLDVEDRKTAEDILGNDPFVKAGLFSEYFVRRFRPSVIEGQAT